jgi:DUF971 family protein
MSSYPTDLKLISPDTLQITWNDGQQHALRVRTLRDRCPCATCREKRSASGASSELLPVLRPEETRPLRIVGMRPVGNYAYSIQFSDGHDTGIYTLALLRELGEQTPSTSP